MIHVEVSTIIHVPRHTVFALYADYRNWPTLFPATIRGTREMHRKNGTTVLEIDHVEGRVINTLKMQPPENLEFTEWKRRYRARFLN